MNDLYTSLQAVGVSNLAVACGQDFGPYEGLLTSMVENLSILSQNARDTVSLLSCERIVPIYVNAVYGGTCTYSVQGVTWTWCALLVVGFMGMLMIMFRSAYLPNNTFDGDNMRNNDELEFSKAYGPQGTYQSEFINDDDDIVDVSDDMSSVYIDGADYAVHYEENSKAPAGNPRVY